MLYEVITQCVEQFTNLLGILGVIVGQDNVEINQVGMITLLVQNLYKAGHRKIGFVV